MKQEIRFCTADDGVRLAYASTGEGPPLLKAANWLSHLEFDLDSPVWTHWLSALSRGRRLIRYDERGCGLSDWQVDDFSFDAWVRDLETVADAAGLERFALFGGSQGAAVAVAYAARHPERVSHLLIYGGFARGWLTAARSEAARAEFEAMRTLTGLGWGRDDPAYRQVFTSRFVPDATGEAVDWFNELQRVTTSPENAVRFLEVFARIDVMNLLADVKAPTLVIHVEGDVAIPIGEGRRMAAGIPDSRFVPLRGRNHILLATEPAWGRFVEEVDAFLPGDPAAAADGDGTRGAASPDIDPHEALVRALDERYDLLELLGEGGMGTVYLARDRRHDRRVAIKTVHPDRLGGGGPERFEREIRLTARLQHPHILPLLDSGVALGVPYYIMPLVEGESLRARLDRAGPLPAREALRVGEDVLEGLAYAHRRDVIHRDVKPDNILLGEGHALLADFGIAKALDAATEDASAGPITKTGGVVGTPAYMAPEQFLGEATPRSDLYAVGAVLFETLSGRRWSPDRDPAGADWSGIPQELGPVLERALDLRPNARWEDAESFRAALTSHPTDRTSFLGRAWRRLFGRELPER